MTTTRASVALIPTKSLWAMLLLLANGAIATGISILGPLASTARVAAHYSVLLTVGTWMLLFYCALWRACKHPTLHRVEWTIAFC